MSTKQDTKTVYIDNHGITKNYAELLLNKLTTAIEDLDKYSPEWRNYGSQIIAKTDEEEEDAFITISYVRYMTKEEEIYAERRKQMLRQGAIDNMKDMIEKYPEEAIKFVESLKAK